MVTWGAEAPADVAFVVVNDVPAAPGLVIVRADSTSPALPPTTAVDRGDGQGWSTETDFAPTPTTARLASLALRSAGAACIRGPPIRWPRPGNGICRAALTATATRPTARRQHNTRTRVVTAFARPPESSEKIGRASACGFMTNVICSTWDSCVQPEHATSYLSDHLRQPSQSSMTTIAKGFYGTVVRPTRRTIPFLALSRAGGNGGLVPPAPILGPPATAMALVSRGFASLVLSGQPPHYGHSAAPQKQRGSRCVVH